MRYFWKKKLQKNAAPVRTGIGCALTHIAVIKEHFKPVIKKHFKQKFRLKNA